MFSLFTSIQQFNEKGIAILESLIEKFLKEPKDMASFVIGVRDAVVRLGLDIISETITDCNNMLRDSSKRKASWVVVKTDEKHLLTSIGDVRYEKTLFRNKSTGETRYLLDAILGLSSHERLSEDAEARILAEAVETSYGKAGEVLLSDSVSRQTVKNKVHGLMFDKGDGKILVEKKKVEYLYIDADEDHVALQHIDEYSRQNNIIAKLVYVYEGIKADGKRNQLINPHYFSGVYSGKANEELWVEVSEYIESHYDTESIKAIYINGDGANWIKAGAVKIVGAKRVLDGYHLRQAVNRIASRIWDGKDYKGRILEAIGSGSRKKFKKLIGEAVVKNIDDIEKVNQESKYILSNWESAVLRIGGAESVVGCSAEGHVSHVLSERLSSRPMGWSRNGVDKMAHLRAYYMNKGDMLELVRASREKVLENTGKENIIVDCKEMINKAASKKSYGKYIDKFTCSVGLQIRKIAWFRDQIWGL